MARADPDSFDERSAAADGGDRTTSLPSLIAATRLAFATLLTNAAAQPDCQMIEDFSKAKVGEFPADWKPRKDSGKDIYRSPKSRVSVFCTRRFEVLASRPRKSTSGISAPIPF